jgi:hypothetical protein
VIHAITGAFNGSFANGYWDDSDTGQAFTVPMAHAIKHDSMYINVHTAANPGGEIRGQVANNARCETGVVSASVPVTATTIQSSYLYPNPASGTITLTFDSPTGFTGSASLTDITGRVLVSNSVIVEQGVNTLQLDLAPLPGGTYYIKLERNNTVVLAQPVVRK